MSWGRRSRNTTRSPLSPPKNHATPSSPVTTYQALMHRMKVQGRTPTDLTESIHESIVHIIRVTDVADAERRVVRSNVKIKWDTKESVAASLRFILASRLRWLAIRTKWYKAGHQIAVMLSRVEHHVTQPSIGLVHRRHGCNPTVEKAVGFQAGLIPTECYEAVTYVVNKWNSLCKELDDIYTQSIGMYEVPPYGDISDHMPRNGVNAFSMLKAVMTGKKDKCLPSDNFLFGWALNLNESGYSSESNIHLNIRQMIRGLDGQLPCEKSGERPSLAKGWRLLTGFISKKGEAPTELSYRYEYQVEKHRRLWQGVVNASSESTQPSMGMVRLLHQHLLCPEDKDFKPSFAKRVVRKICGGENNNDVATIFTAMPYRISGDDYAVRCVYADVRYGSRRNATKRGYCLLRRGWPDMIHVEQLPETAAAIAARLDQASNSYFQRQRNDADRKLTTSQRRAKIIRTLRLLPKLTREDSYAVSNCVPGTESFINLLRLPGDEIDGKTLARRWSQEEYPQIDRLANVAYYLKKITDERLAATLVRQEETMQQLMVSEGGPDLPDVDAQFPVETSETQEQARQQQQDLQDMSEVAAEITAEETSTADSQGSGVGTPSEALALQNS